MIEAINQSRSGTIWNSRHVSKFGWNGLAAANDHQREISLERSLRDSCGSITRSAGSPGLHVQLGLQVTGVCPAAYWESVVWGAGELTSNAVEHGFYRRETGRIHVHVTHHPAAGTQVVVSDDGWGFPAGPVIDGNGFRLLRSLGALHVQPDASYASMRTVVTLTPSIRPQWQDDHRLKAAGHAVGK